MFPIEEGVDVSAPMDQAMEHGLIQGIGGVPVLEKGAIVGILRDADIAEAVEFRSLQAEGPLERAA